MRFEKHLTYHISRLDLTAIPKDTLVAIIAGIARDYLDIYRLERFDMPRKTVWSNDRGAIRCPNCGHDLMGGIDGDFYSISPPDDPINHCWECGQRLDWAAPDYDEPGVQA